MITFLCGHHLRCGRESILTELPGDVLVAICKLAFPRLRTIYTLISLTPANFITDEEIGFKLIFKNKKIRLKLVDNIL